MDALTDAHLWADRFDGSLEDVFDLQDKVASSVAGVIEPALQAAEVERARRKLPQNLDAYDWYLRALSALYSYTAEGKGRALELLRRSIAIDPNYAAALAETAFCFARRRQMGLITEGDPEIAEGVGLARAAIAAGREDATVLANASFSLWLLTRDTDNAARSIDRAVTLNPNSAIACGYSGIVHA
jgi:tetratricopeptide (TPR) repeat protein